MNTVISILLMFTYNSLNKDIYYLIATYILDHLDQMDKISINELAQNCHTSVSTINKLCHLMGFETFKKMKNMLICTKNGRLDQIYFRYSQFDENDIYGQIECLYRQKINQTALFNEIDKVVALIYQAKSIYLLGALYPLSLTLNFIEDMRIFNKPIYIVHSNYQECDELYSKDSLLIFITITGRFLSMNKQSFLNLYEKETVKKVIISQNKSFSIFSGFNAFIQLYGNDDNEIENLVLIEILNLIKYNYFTRYVKDS